MLSDLRFAFRLLAKSPAFTVLAVLSLSAAIGVNSGIFSIVDAAFLRPFIAHHSDEVVKLFTARKEAESDFRQFSYPEFRALAEPNEIFSDLGAMEFATTGVGFGDNIRRSVTFIVTDGYFRIYGGQPAQGRFFTGEESRAGAAIPVAVLSDALWRRLGHNPDIVGSSLRINGQIFTVVGVMPRTFSGGNALIGPELWVPLGARDLLTSPLNLNDGLPLDHPRSFELNLIACLKPGVTPETAIARLPTLAARLDTVKADNAAGPRVLIMQAPSRINLSTEPSKDEENFKTYATLLLGLAGVVLLIACLNLANLVLARSAARSREFAIRTAVGATRTAIIRQLLIEGLLLSLAGGAFGLLLATWANELLVNSVTQLLSTIHFNITLPLTPEPRTVLATFGFCTVATLLFALAPAWRVSRTAVASELKQQGQADHNQRALSHFFAPRQLLFMAQLALALMLLFSAGLFVRGAVTAASVSPGFDPRGGLVAEYDYTLLNLPAATMRQRASESMLRAGALPGVEHVAIGTLLPYSIQSEGRSINAVGGTLTKEGKPEVVGGLFNAVSTGYFATIGVPVQRGRDFTETEAANPNARVVIIDEMMAKKLFPDRDALGQRVQFSTPEKDGSRSEFEIVGIVGAHRHDILSAQAPKRIFVPLAYGFQGAGYLHVKLTRADEAAISALGPMLRAELRRGDPAFPLLALRTFSDIVESNDGRWIVQLGATLFGVFGGIAFILAIAGVYGVKAYAVELRQREIGIRMAIGARQVDVLRLFLGQGLRQIGTSLGFGLLLSFVAGKALSTMLYHVNPFDPLVLTCAGSLLATAAVLATWLPARRATQVDPCIVLRSE